MENTTEKEVNTLNIDKLLTSYSGSDEKLNIELNKLRKLLKEVAKFNQETILPVKITIENK